MVKIKIETNSIKREKFAQIECAKCSNCLQFDFDCIWMAIHLSSCCCCLFTTRLGRCKRVDHGDMRVVRYMHRMRLGKRGMSKLERRHRFWLLVQLRMSYRLERQQLEQQQWSSGLGWQLELQRHQCCEQLMMSESYNRLGCLTQLNQHEQLTNKRWKKKQIATNK